jgi:hypothetical protein
VSEHLVDILKEAFLVVFWLFELDVAEVHDEQSRLVELGYGFLESGIVHIQRLASLVLRLAAAILILTGFLDVFEQFLAFVSPNNPNYFDDCC